MKKGQREESAKREGEVDRKREIGYMGRGKGVGSGVERGKGVGDER